MWFFFAATITANPQSCLSTLPLQLFRAHGTTKDVAKLVAFLNGDVSACRYLSTFSI